MLPPYLFTLGLLSNSRRWFTCNSISVTCRKEWISKRHISHNLAQMALVLLEKLGGTRKQPQRHQVILHHTIYSRPIHTTHAVPLPCRAAKGLEYVFPTQCGCVWFTLAMICPCHALTMPFFSRPRHSTAVERRPVGYLPAFGFFRLPRVVPRRLLSEAYQSSSQRSIPTTVKSNRSRMQKKGDLLNC